MAKRTIINPNKTFLKKKRRISFANVSEVRIQMMRTFAYFGLVNTIILLYNTIILKSYGLYKSIVVFIAASIVFVILYHFDKRYILKSEQKYMGINNPILMEILDEIKQLRKNGGYNGKN